MNRLLLILLVPAIIIGAGCIGTAPTPTPTVTATPEPTATPVPPCKVQAESYIAEVERTSLEWDDANALANKTARVALSQPVSQLQKIRRDVAALSPPACAQNNQKLLLDYMDAVIDAYLSFMQDDPVYSRKMKNANSKLEIWAEDFAKLKAGVEPYN